MEAGKPVQDVLYACDDVHNVSTCLGRWLRDQPRMIPSEVFPKCDQLVADSVDGPACERFVAELPQPGQRLLRLLLALLQQVDADATRMTADNLGRVFAMTIIKREDPMEMVQHATGDAAFVSHLIQRLPVLAETQHESEPELEPEPDDVAKVSGNDPVAVPEPQLQPQSEPESNGLGDIDHLDSIAHLGAEPSAPEPEPEESTKESKPSAPEPEPEESTKGSKPEPATPEPEPEENRPRAESSAANEKLDDLRSSRAKRSGQAAPSKGKGKSGGTVEIEQQVQEPEPVQALGSIDHLDNIAHLGAEPPGPEPEPEESTKESKPEPEPEPEPEPDSKPENPAPVLDGIDV